MRALTWHGKHDVAAWTPSPIPRSSIRATRSSRSPRPRSAAPTCTSTTAISRPCSQGDILGHEFMGEVVEVGPKITLQEGPARRRPVHRSPAATASSASKQQYSACDNSNPADNAGHARDALRLSDGRRLRLLAPDRRLCRRAGRICPRALIRTSARSSSRTGSRTTRCCSCPTSCRPAGWRPRMPTSSRATPSRSGAAARSACSRSRSRLLMGAHRVIAIDHYPAPAGAGQASSAPRVINFDETDVLEALMEMTGGIGPDAVHRRGRHGERTASPSTISSTRSRPQTFLGTDRPHALRQAILACRKGGRVSIPGVYGGLADKFPIGALMEKGLTLQDRPDPRPEIHAAAARADRGGQDRHHLPDLPPPAAGGGARGLQASSTTSRTSAPRSS